MGDEPEQEDESPEPPPPVSTSEMCKEGNGTTIIWHLKGWNENADFLKDNAGCIIEVPIDGGGDPPGEEEEKEAEPPEEGEDEKPEDLPSPPVKFRFFFKEYSSQVESKLKRWYSLWVSLLSGQKEICCLVEVVEIEDEEEEGEAEGEEEAAGEDEGEDDDDDEDIVVKAQITMSVDKENGDDGEISAVVENQFIPMSWWKTDGNGNKSGDEHLTEWAESDELKFKITVTLYHYTGSDTEITEEDKGDDEGEKEGEETEEEEEQVPMIRDLKAMYAREENYADVTLETRDGMILNAHKFVLAARSAYFRGIIEKEVQKKGFTGLIKLANVDGKPMTVVLHWMYTDEIQEEQLGKVMDEVIKVSVKWELKDLLKMLDKKLITVCNTRNMLHLFQVAHKNGLYTAIGDISEYIKENIDSVLPMRRQD